MENYYDKLHLNAESSIQELNAQLVQLEKVWHQRELVQPEKAREMLVLIDKAKSYFADDETKAEYDRKLSETGGEPVDEGQVNFEKLFNKANDFYESKEYDLAKTAIEKALSYYDDESDNLEFIYKVACIYRENNDYERALQYLNKAIVIAPNAWFLYKDKGFICEDQITNFKKALEIIKKEISERGETEYLRNSKSQMLGLIARYYLNVLGDYYSAERLANAAIECGDAYGMGSAVIEDMKKPFPVGYQSLLSYENEKSNIVEEISRLVAQIINNNQLYKDDLAGWILTKKRCKCTNPDDPHTTEYAYVLCVDGSFRRFESEYSEHNEEYDKPGSTVSFDSAVLLQEFDYSGYFNSTYNNGDAIHIIKSTLAWDQTHTNKSSVTLNRLCYKGVGLYNALKEIVDKDKHPIIIDRPRPEEYRAKMNQIEEETNRVNNERNQIPSASAYYFDYVSPPGLYKNPDAEATTIVSIMCQCIPPILALYGIRFQGPLDIADDLRAKDEKKVAWTMYGESYNPLRVSFTNENKIVINFSTEKAVQGTSNSEIIYDIRNALIEKGIIKSSELPKPYEQKSSGGCYVATCIYGSYDCPQVWVLRRFRDYTLAKNWCGRVFIRAYYAISPTLVKWLGNTIWFKNMWKPTLDKMVRTLTDHGVSDKPYND